MFKSYAAERGYRNQPKSIVPSWLKIVGVIVAVFLLWHFLPTLVSLAILGGIGYLAYEFSAQIGKSDPGSRVIGAFLTALAAWATFHLVFDVGLIHKFIDLAIGGGAILFAFNMFSPSPWLMARWFGRRATSRFR